MGEQAGVPVFEMGTEKPVKIAQAAIRQAKDYGYDYVLIDTAGRLQIDEALMGRAAADEGSGEPLGHSAGGGLHGPARKL